MRIFKQRAIYDCLLACIATAVQRDYGDIWPVDFLEAVEDAKGTYGDNVTKAFSLAGLNHNTDYWTVGVAWGWERNAALRNLLHGRRAILQVPSLNYQGAQHMVYWNGETLYDPSNDQVYQRLDQCSPSYVFIFNEAKGWPAPR